MTLRTRVDQSQRGHIYYNSPTKAVNKVGSLLTPLDPSPRNIKPLTMHGHALLSSPYARTKQRTEIIRLYCQRASSTCLLCSGFTRVRESLAWVAAGSSDLGTRNVCGRLDLRVREFLSCKEPV